MCDLLLKNVNIFNAYLKKFIKGDIYIKENKIFYIDYFQKPLKDGAKRVVDLNGAYASAGFIDIHMHIESSMMTPPPFCEYLSARGITTIVAEPHEIANVFGVRGIKSMINSSKNSPIDVFFGIPSSVPSTNSDLEGTGASINYEQMVELLSEKSALCVGEIMNYRQIIKDDNNLEITKFLDYLQKNRPDFVIEGHCPKLVDEELAKFLYLGINGDHTEHDLLEIKQRYMMGMFVELQAKMLKDDILQYIKENNLYHHTSFVTDDVMTDTLYYKGHLDYVLKAAIKKGFGLENTIYCATYTPALRMGLKDRGALAPGKIADIIIYENVNDLSVKEVYKKGKLVKANLDFSGFKFDEIFYDSINVGEISSDDFMLNKAIFTKNPKNFNCFDEKCYKTDKKINAKLLKVSENTTQIKADDISLDFKDGKIIWDDYLLGACFNRYGSNEVSYALFSGNCINRGAIATTWAHDHHNLFVLGKNPSDMALAANTLKNCGGGIVAVENGEILGLLELKIAGILSDESVECAAKKLEKVRTAFNHLGYKHANEIMSFGTLGLACSPFFKLTDKGLVDVTNSKIIPAFWE